MRTTVILAVLCAGLLVLTGAAFAQCPGCAGYYQCYGVSGTDLNNPVNNFTNQSWLVCFDGLPGSFVCIDDGASGIKLALIYNGLNLNAIGWDTGSVGIRMTFHGNDNAFNGLYSDYSSPGNLHRYEIHGVAGNNCMAMVEQ